MILNFDILFRKVSIYHLNILSYQGLRLSNLTLGLTALFFSDKPKIVTTNMINHKAVQKSITIRPPDKTA